MTTPVRSALPLLAAVTVVTGWVLFIPHADEYPIVALAGLVVGTSTFAWALRCVRPGRDRQLAAATAVTAVTVPTFFVWLPNAVLLVAVLAFVVTRVRRRRVVE